MELKKNPAYDIAAPADSEPADYPCAECGGRLLGWPAKENGRIRYYCEHDPLCDNQLPACDACNTALPQRRADAAEAYCSCGARYPGCPQCASGWLVERKGPYSAFLGCIRYPACTGKAQILL